MTTKDSPERGGCGLMAALFIVSFAVIGPGLIIWGLRTMSDDSVLCGDRPMTRDVVCQVSQYTDYTGQVYSRGIVRPMPANGEIGGDARTFDQLVANQHDTGMARVRFGIVFVVAELVGLGFLARAAIRRRR